MKYARVWNLARDLDRQSDRLALLARGGADTSILQAIHHRVLLDVNARPHRRFLAHRCAIFFTARMCLARQLREIVIMPMSGYGTPFGRGREGWHLPKWLFRYLGSGICRLAALCARPDRRKRFFRVKWHDDLWGYYNRLIDAKRLKRTIIHPRRPAHSS
jgi:hypothetical protein